MNNEIKNKLLTSVIHCYILFIENRAVFDLNIILNYTSMVPIYIQFNHPAAFQAKQGEKSYQHDADKPADVIPFLFLFLYP